MDKKTNPENFNQETISVIELNGAKAIQVANFLPEEERNTLFEAVCREQARFVSPGLPGTPGGSTRFFSLDSEGNDENNCSAIQKAYEPFSIRVIEQVSGFCKALGIPPISVSHIPISLISGLHGHSGEPHTDSTGGQYRISILYYFHKEPKAFSGGDLEFYATDMSASRGYSTSALHSIPMQDNLLVVFPSETFHGVTRVYSDSTDFADGRFVAVGFLGD